MRSEEKTSGKSPGRINFENVLQNDLERANEFYRNGQFKKFVLATQQVWQNCLREDRDAILELVEEMSSVSTVDPCSLGFENSENRQRDFRDQQRGVRENITGREEFLEYLQSNPHYTTGRSKFRKKKLGKWRRIFTILNNGLKERYFGGKEKLY